MGTLKAERSLHFHIPNDTQHSTRSQLTPKTGQHPNFLSLHGKDSGYLFFVGAGDGMDRRLLERLATTMDHLVSFPTVENDSRALHACVEWTRAHVFKHRPRLKVKPFLSNDKPSILFTAGDAPPRLLFLGHLDVVEAVHQSAFTTTQEDSVRLRGRGTADMKGPVAAMLDVMEHEPQTGM